MTIDARTHIAAILMAGLDHRTWERRAESAVEGADALLAELAKPCADAALARAEKAEAERDEAHTALIAACRGRNDAIERAEKAEAERDEARAELARLRERVAKVERDRDAYASLVPTLNAECELVGRLSVAAGVPEAEAENCDRAELEYVIRARIAGDQRPWGDLLGQMHDEIQADLNRRAASTPAQADGGAAVGVGK